MSKGNDLGLLDLLKGKGHGADALAALAAKAPAHEPADDEPRRARSEAQRSPQPDHSTHGQPTCAGRMRSRGSAAIARPAAGSSAAAAVGCQARGREARGGSVPSSTNSFRSSRRRFATPA